MQHQAIKNIPHIGHLSLSFQSITHALCIILYKMLMIDEEKTCAGKGK